MRPRVEYSITVPVPASTAFMAFQDLDRLLHRGIYEEAVWVEGVPWQVGSRLRYIITQPIQVTVSAVVSSIDPPHTIGLLNHALGITADQHIYFGPDPKGGTRVQVTMELIGKSFDLSETALGEAANFIVKDSLDSMAALCRRRASSASGK